MSLNQSTKKMIEIKNRLSPILEWGEWRNKIHIVPHIEGRHCLPAWAITLISYSTKVNNNDVMISKNNVKMKKTFTARLNILAFIILQRLLSKKVQSNF